MSTFSPFEWNALMNRARATLQAQRCCAAQEGSEGCVSCPLAAVPLGTPESRDLPCRKRFRATRQRLSALVREAPPAQQAQLQRTLDGLELAYRQLCNGEEEQ